MSSGDGDNVTATKSPIIGESATDYDSDDATSLDGFIVDDEAPGKIPLPFAVQ